MTDNVRFFAKVNDQVAEVAQSDFGTILVNGLIGQDSDKRLVLLGSQGDSLAAAISVPVMFLHRGNFTVLSVMADDDDKQKIDDYLNSRVVAPFFAKSGSVISALPVPRVKAPIVSGTRQTAVLAGIAFLLTALILGISLLRTSDIEAQVAFVAIPGSAQDTPSSGFVQYIQDSGQLQAGEFFASLRSRMGNPVFLEARRAGEVSLADPNSTYSKMVLKGTALINLANGAPKPYAAVFMQGHATVEALHIGKATMELVRTGEKFDLDVGIENVVLKSRRLVDAQGNELTELNIKLPDNFADLAGEALHVSFRRDFTMVDQLKALLSFGGA